MTVQTRRGSRLSSREKVQACIVIGMSLVLLPTQLAAQFPSRYSIKDNHSDRSDTLRGTTTSGCMDRIPGAGPSLPRPPILSDSASRTASPADCSSVLCQPRFQAPVSILALLKTSGLSSLRQPQTQQRPRDKTKYSSSATAGSPGHIFWVVPAYKVDYQHAFKPLTAREKFQEWAESTYDPLGVAIGAVEAGTLQYSSADGFCGYGHGWAGYGKCFGSMQLDSTDSSFIGDYALTVLLHQDPRYFRLGSGSLAARSWYAITRVFVTHKDSGGVTFYTSALTGTIVAATVSNLYYPQTDVGVGPTISRIGIDLGNTALYNGAAEFWPDIHRSLDKIF